MLSALLEGLGDVMQPGTSDGIALKAKVADEWNRELTRFCTRRSEPFKLSKS